MDTMDKPALGLALGMIELYGCAAAIDTADAVAKAADVKVVRCQKSGEGYMTLFIIGDTASVYTAVDAGCQYSRDNFQGPDMHFVIPYPGPETLLYAYYWDKWVH